MTKSNTRAFSHPLIDDFVKGLKFELDDFQEESCFALTQKKSVLVAAPTGAGKTIVAEFAVYLAMKEQQKIFYTAPMKALSNQKFQELCAVYGAENVGILTGDTNINPHAQIVVMTTEVLRNMIYTGSDLLQGLAWVIMDEVHYLADRFRGAVWEEVIIHLPQSTRLIALSATVSNAEEFGDWLRTVRGHTEVIVSENRPIPLHQHVSVGNEIIDLFLSGTSRVNPDLVQLTTNSRNRYRSRNPHQRHHESRNRVSRSRMIEDLAEINLLPAIFFIFSRVGCDAAVQQVMNHGVQLTTAEERAEIRATVEERCQDILEEDLAVLGYWEWFESLQRGVASHHAGLLPIFKEVVEDLYRRKLVKVVFATETLALGINMPARSVVLEKLVKFNGEARVPITPGEYTQLTGRAGRRGIDTEGHAVIQWVEGMNPEDLAALASKRSYPLISSFKPGYNMSVNLIDQFGVDRTRTVLESSFAQFQADRAVVGLAKAVRQQEEALSGYTEPMTCHLGDFPEFARLRRELSDIEKANTQSFSKSK
ncbi:MAG: DEAD/DEAH box helicase, partial [Microbacteriaceae bacterium]